MTGLPNAEFIFASRALDRRVILRYGVNSGGGGVGVKISVNLVGVLVLVGRKRERWSNDSWVGVLLEELEAVMVSEISSITVEVVEGE
jgi:hypothetical protein